MKGDKPSDLQGSPVKWYHIKRISSKVSFEKTGISKAKSWASKPQTSAWYDNLWEDESFSRASNGSVPSTSGRDVSKLAVKLVPTPPITRLPSIELPSRNKLPNSRICHANTQLPLHSPQAGYECPEKISVSDIQADLTFVDLKKPGGTPDHWHRQCALAG